MSCKKSSSLNHGQIHFWRDSWGFPRSELFLCKSGSLTTLINHFQSILFLNFTALENLWPTQWTVCSSYVNKVAHLVTQCGKAAGGGGRKGAAPHSFMGPTSSALSPLSKRDSQCSDLASVISKAKNHNLVLGLFEYKEEKIICNLIFFQNIPWLKISMSAEIRVFFFFFNIILNWNRFFRGKKSVAWCNIALGCFLIIQRSHISTLGFHSPSNDKIIFFGHV